MQDEWHPLQFARPTHRFRSLQILLLLASIAILLLAACTGSEPPAAPATSAPAAQPATAEATEPPADEGGDEAAPTPQPAEDTATETPEAMETTEAATEPEATEAPEDEPAPAAAQPLPYDVTLPPGFAISIYADNVPNARSMTLSPNGTLFVGTRTQGAVYAILDTNQDYQADEVITLARGLNMPNGVAFRDGALYVAEISRVLRYDNIEADLNNPPEPVVVDDTFPTDEHHGWKFIRFGPDGLLYVPVGAPCNICDTDGTGYAVITRMEAGGANKEVYAEGIRNTVGFDWHPETGELWFTDNGRDLLGDDIPPDELNHAPQAGLHFGYPYCHAGTVVDPEFGQGRTCEEFTPPAMVLGPHVASLGMRFYTGDMFPEEYHHQIFIAEHGSWNRTVPIGYQISLVRLEDNSAVSYEPFATGWLLENGDVLGRPVDLLVLPDGSLLVSDDHAGMIYRIHYEGG